MKQEKRLCLKRAIVAVSMAIFVLSGLFAGCAGGVIIGSGNLETQEIDFSGFTSVEVGHAFEVEIVRSDSYSLSITADDNLFEHTQVSQEGETLKVGLKPLLGYVSGTLRAEITMPALTRLDLSGATRGSIEGFSSPEDFDLDLSGASSLDMSDMAASDIQFDLSGASRVGGDITATGDGHFDLSGASRVELAGSASDIVIEASGASAVELASFPVNNANVKLSGASHATLNLDGRLDADLSGASKLSYIGEPTMGTINTSGGSTVSKS
jgi:hypothetical protein